MFKIKDVFQIRNIERIIRRPLTTEELNQIDEGESLILETPSGGFMIRHVDTLTIRDLIDETIDWENTDWWDRNQNTEKIKKDDKEDHKVFKATMKPEELAHNKSRSNFLKVHGFDDIEDCHGNIERQVFQTPKLNLTQPQYLDQVQSDSLYCNHNGLRSRRFIA